ncbi:undecaprenyl-phosphate glucose phosphotransferase [Moritella sp. 24]|uniref:undecaprenyl-phosphate glucose phosphotransferase n=1 Tax=Moritella sp. 24 TaxID=2746230 RepID=UPI001BAA854B|nr:undecaprenyl-phosphate glucose phosphotransferase [Moritella sp. 24]QUM76611.1 undecaprenyl-phosphate glucose phosphotransferase [Moritella sp. 24]
MKPVNTFKVSSSDYSFVYRFLDLSCVTFSLMIVIHSYNLRMTQDYIIIALTTLIVILYIAEALNLYQSWRVGRFITVLMTVTAVFISSFLVLTAIGIWLKSSFAFPSDILNVWFLASFLSCFTWRILKYQWSVLRCKLGINLQKMAILGATSTGANLYNEISSCDELGFDFVGFFDDRDADRLPDNLTITSNISDAILEAKNGGIDVLFITLPISAEKRIAEIINLLSDTTVDVYVVPVFMLSEVMHGRVTHVGKIDALSIFESPYLGSKIWLKRFEDIVVSLLAITLLSPVYILIAIILKLTSAGPVLFKQSRYGLHGEKISVFKFRSMTVMESDGEVTQTTRDDKRVTPFGAFLRRTSLDELPQFFNVLLGDMSVVGPRPHAVSHNEEYRKLIQFYMLRHHVKPGITGWAQVSGWRGETDTLDKMQKRVEFDLYYILQWSIWFDLKILMLTVTTCLKSEDTY